MKKAAGLMVVMALVCAPAWAGTQAGQSEVQIGGSLQRIDYGSDSDTTTTLMTGQLVFNRFLSDAFSVGGALRVSSSLTESGDTDNESAQIYFLGRADLYLAPGADVVPYLGGQAGIISYTYDDGNETDSTIIFGAHGGLKFFMSEQISWNLEGDASIYEPADNEDDEDAVTILSLFISLSYYF